MRPKPAPARLLPQLAITLTLALVLTLVLGLPGNGQAHPLRLSVSELEYSSKHHRLTISLRLFLADVNEALVFDPNSTALAFGQTNEAPEAERLLLDYLQRFFSVMVNGASVPLRIKSKSLSGQGIDTALNVLIESSHAPPVTSLEVRNAVFTDLFFDQTNIIYVHMDENTRGLMLNKKTPSHKLTF